MSSYRSVCLVAALFLISASSTLAGPGVRKDKGASNNGPGILFADCLAASGTPSNCANFTTSPVSTINGVPVFNFVVNPGTGDPAQVFDVFQLPGTIAPNSTVTFTFNSLTGNYGAFACDNSSDPTSGTALDSLGNPLTGPCTAGSTDSLASFLSETDGLNTATFKFLGGAGFPTSWTFYTDKGNLAGIDLGGGGTTTTPEPSSLVLLLAGALVLGLVSTKRS
jgi:hypothetical protein